MWTHWGNQTPSLLWLCPPLSLESTVEMEEQRNVLCARPGKWVWLPPTFGHVATPGYKGCWECSPAVCLRGKENWGAIHNSFWHSRCAFLDLTWLVEWMGRTCFWEEGASGLAVFLTFDLQSPIRHTRAFYTMVQDGQTHAHIWNKSFVEHLAWPPLSHSATCFNYFMLFFVVVVVKFLFSSVCFICLRDLETHDIDFIPVQILQPTIWKTLKMTMEMWENLNCNGQLLVSWQYHLGFSCVQTHFQKHDRGMEG